MIPLRLTLKNFMPYRDNVPPLSFEGIHVACLTGDNGHGKSAIFDAVTWALWGKSRADHDDELIHIGQSDMSVEFDFAVGEQRYRVIRKLSKTASGKTRRSELDLLIAGESGYKAISGDTITDTEERIKGLLRMDYETFINSAFLKQGQADEFTRKPPSSRKEVIGNIMGLSVYDELAGQARERETEKEMEVERLASALAELEHQMEGRSADEAELARIEPQLAGLQKQMKTQEETVSGLRKDNELLQAKRGQLSDLRQRLSRSGRERQEWQSRAEACRQRIGQLEKLVTEAEAIQSGYARLVEARKLDEELSRKLTAVHALDQHKSELEKAIVRAQDKLVAAAEEASRRVAEAERKVARLPELDKALAAKHLELEQLEKDEEAVRTAQDRLGEIVGGMAALQSEITRLDRELKAVQEKLGLLAQGDTHCPLCETMLGDEGVARLRTKLKAEEEDKQHARVAAEQALTQKRKEYVALEKTLAQKKVEIDRLRLGKQKEAAALEKEHADITQAQEELSRLKDELKAAEERLARREYAIEEQKRLGVLEQERVGIDYGAARHEQVRQELAGLVKYEALRQQVLDAGHAIDEQKALLSGAIEAESRFAGVIAEDEGLEKTLQDAIESMAEVPGRLSVAEEALRRLGDEERILRDHAAALQEKIRRYAELEAQGWERERQRKEAAEEASVFKQLAEAFGKKGIQALLIEQAIPEIEDEANRLLGRMTDGRMALKLETQKEARSKKGAVIETLDIRIADELGSRNYEMFSGGEAFRINLALRIALSKLLVNRAGASLPTLIIDEGFGTQDTSAREKLVDAIRSIQDEFKKIIVITHLEDLKDAFPVRINVTKTGEGSMIEVV
ncbi:MAG: SMC family ATPase [Chloroflexota bacterium]